MRVICQQGPPAEHGLIRLTCLEPHAVHVGLLPQDVNNVCPAYRRMVLAMFSPSLITGLTMPDLSEM